MDHKAFIFDVESFNLELRPLLLSAGIENEIGTIKHFINCNLIKIVSPYTGDSLGEDWENQLESGDIQEIADFALTRYYSPAADMGLGYSWDALLETIKLLPVGFDPEYCIVGKQVQQGTFVFDPSRMGLGMIEMKDVSYIHQELQRVRPLLKNVELPAEELLYELSTGEIAEAFEDLIVLYKKAIDANRGILMTF